MQPITLQEYAAFIANAERRPDEAMILRKLKTICATPNAATDIPPAPGVEGPRGARKYLAPELLKLRIMLAALDLTLDTPSILSLFTQPKFAHIQPQIMGGSESSFIVEAASIRPFGAANSQWRFYWATILPNGDIDRGTVGRAGPIDAGAFNPNGTIAGWIVIPVSDLMRPILKEIQDAE